MPISRLCFPLNLLVQYIWVDRSEIQTCKLYVSDHIKGVCLLNSSEFLNKPSISNPQSSIPTGLGPLNVFSFDLKVGIGKT